MKAVDRVCTEPHEKDPECPEEDFMRDFPPVVVAVGAGRNAQGQEEGKTRQEAPCHEGHVEPLKLVNEYAELVNEYLDKVLNTLATR